jgi:hypothetical protein
MIVLQDWNLPRTLVAPARPRRRPAPRCLRRQPRALAQGDLAAGVLEAERDVIAHALEQCRWNRVKTAKMLRISYRALLYKIKDMGLKQTRCRLRRPILRNTAWYGAVTLGGLVSGLVMSVILARGLVPSLMGDHSYVVWAERMLTALARAR